MNLMQKPLFGTSTHHKNHYDMNARVTTANYYNQLSKRSHFQLVSWVAKTCTNMSRLVTKTSHPVNNHYNSNPDTIWTNLVYATWLSLSNLALLKLSCEGWILSPLEATNTFKRWKFWKAGTIYIEFQLHYFQTKQIFPRIRLREAKKKFCGRIYYTVF